MPRSSTCLALRPLWLAAFALLSLSCSSQSPSEGPPSDSERRSIRIQQAGGQTGMEGTCLPVPEPEPFSAEDVRALVEGSLSTTLAFRSAGPTTQASLDSAQGIPMKITVQAQGEARVRSPDAGEGCNFALEQDVEVALRFDDPPLDVLIEATADAFSSTFAVLLSELPPAVASALGLPARKSTFELSFTEHGMEGTLEGLSDCAEVVFPPDVRCPEWPEIEVDMDRERHGFRPSAALSAIDALKDLPLQWEDGSETTLSVSLVQAPEWACGERSATYCPEFIDMSLSVHVATGDGRVDSEVSATLTAEFATEASATEMLCGEEGQSPGELLRVGLGVEGILPWSSQLGPDATPADGDRGGLHLHLSIDQGEGVHLDVQELAPSTSSEGTVDPEAACTGFSSMPAVASPEP